ESVAWVAERKDVLSTLFFMLTLLAYGKYVSEKAESRKQKGEIQGPKLGCENRESRHEGTLQQAPSGIQRAAPRSTLHAPRFYIFSLLFFACGLMSKTMVVTLPLVLLLLDWWPLRRLKLTAENRKTNTFLPLLLEKLPFL